MTKPDKVVSPFVIILAGTVIAGALGYITLVVAGNGLGARDFTTFAALWSAVFLVAGTLTGFQQEFSRSISVGRSSTSTEKFRYRTWQVISTPALILGLSIFTLLGVLYLFNPDIFILNLWLTLPVEAIFYIFLVVLTGSFYGVQAWWTIFGLVVSEAFFRIVFVVGMTLGFIPTEFLAATLVVPFMLCASGAILLWRKNHGMYLDLDKPLTALWRNNSATVLASFSMAVVISGLPLFLRLLIPASDSIEVSSIMALLLLVRAPLLVIIQSLQSLIVVTFVGARFQIKKIFFISSLGLILLIIFSVFMDVIGLRILENLTELPVAGAGFQIYAVVLSAGLVGAQLIVTSKLLSDSKHSMYATSWVVSAFFTVLGIVLTAENQEWGLWAFLIIPPVLGILTPMIWQSLISRPTQGAAPTL